MYLNMYMSIPYKKFDIENISFKKKKKKDKDYIKIVYKLYNTLINDLYINTPELVCLNIKKCFNTKIKNKYSCELQCSSTFISFIANIENKIQHYYSNNIRNEHENKHEHISIINNNTIRINIFKDIYTGFTIHNLNDGDIKIDIEKIDNNIPVKLLIAFNYIWLNNYNYGLSWRIIGMERLLPNV